MTQQRELVCSDLNAGLDRLRADGFRLEVIYPADDPHSAILSREGDSVRLTTRPGELRPSGELAPFAPEFAITRTGTSSAEGRAGMLYRDLIPGRLGGRYIASHITIPEGGPVPDWVHFHRIAFQMIFVRAGWVRVVYEDQGEAFVMHAGDLVLQPPQIRHRVLDSSAGLEVIEVSAPALHETFADHEMHLPNDGRDPDRIFGGQRFLHHVAANTPWTPFGGGEAQETDLARATGGLGEARVVRSGRARELNFPPHEGELVFVFVLDGSAELKRDGSHAVDAGDSFVIRPQEPWTLAHMSPDFQLLHVTTSRLG